MNPDRIVFVNELTSDITRDELTRLLERFGRLTSLSMHAGWAKAEFSSSDGANVAINTLHGATYKNKRLHVSSTGLETTKRHRADEEGEDTSFDLARCTTAEIGQILDIFEKGQGLSGPDADRATMIKSLRAVQASRANKRARYLSVQEKLLAITAAEEEDLDPALQLHLEKAREGCDAFLS